MIDIVKDSGKFFKDQYDESIFACLNERGRFLFGLIRLEEYLANMSAAWLHGAWQESEMDELVKSGILDPTSKCAAFIESGFVGSHDAESMRKWKIISSAIKQLEFCEKPNLVSIKALLLLLPIFVSRIQASIGAELGLSAANLSVVSPEFSEKLKSKSIEMGFAEAEKNSVSKYEDYLGSRIEFYEKRLSENN
jgi:hypothetical protein